MRRSLGENWLFFRGETLFDDCSASCKFGFKWNRDWDVVEKKQPFSLPRRPPSRTLFFPRENVWKLLLFWLGSGRKWKISSSSWGDILAAEESSSANASVSGEKRFEQFDPKDHSMMPRLHKTTMEKSRRRKTNLKPSWNRRRTCPRHQQVNPLPMGLTNQNRDFLKAKVA